VETVTGHSELRTEDSREIERFVSEHLDLLEDHEISIRKTPSGYLAEFYRANEPTT
jgi:hypothetical protein